MVGTIIKSEAPEDLLKYDDSPPIKDKDGVIVNDGLTDFEKDDAVFHYNIFIGKCALSICTGEIGSGKDVFCATCTFKHKKYFPKRKAVLDFLPRRPYGAYYYFDKAFIVEQVDRMTKMAKEDCSKSDIKEALKNFDREKATEEWVTSAGQVFLRNSDLWFQEFRKYQLARRPGHPLGILLTDVYNVRRHLQAVIYGTTVRVKDLDKKSCLPFVTYHVKMYEDTGKNHYFIAVINKVKWDEHKEDFTYMGKVRYGIDGSKPRPEIGLKPPIDTIEGRLARELSFDPASEYYCFMDLFNSENAIQLEASKSLRREA